MSLSVDSRQLFCIAWGRPRTVECQTNHWQNPRCMWSPSWCHWRAAANFGKYAKCFKEFATMWCPRSIAKLVNITLISLGLMVDISIVNGIISQQKSLGGGTTLYLQWHRVPAEPEVRSRILGSISDCSLLIYWRVQLRPELYQL